MKVSRTLLRMNTPSICKFLVILLCITFYNLYSSVSSYSQIRINTSRILPFVAFSLEESSFVPEYEITATVLMQTNVIKTERPTQIRIAFISLLRLLISLLKIRETCLDSSGI